MIDKTIKTEHKPYINFKKKKMEKNRRISR